MLSPEIIQLAARRSVTTERWSVIAIGIAVIGAGVFFGWMGGTRRGRWFARTRRRWSVRRHPPIALTLGQKVVLRWFTLAVSALFVLGGIAIVVSAFVVNLEAP